MSPAKLLLPLILTSFLLASAFAQESFMPASGSQAQTAEPAGDIMEVVVIVGGVLGACGAYYCYKGWKNRNSAPVEEPVVITPPFVEEGDPNAKYLRAYGSYSIDTGVFRAGRDPDPLRDLGDIANAGRRFLIGGIEDFIKQPTPENLFWAGVDVFSFVPGVAVAKVGKAGKAIATGIKVSPKIEGIFVKEAMKVRPMIITSRNAARIEKNLVREGLPAVEAQRKVGKALGFYFNRKNYLNKNRIEEYAAKIGLSKKVLRKEVNLHEQGHWTLSTAGAKFTSSQSADFASDLLVKQIKPGYGKTIHAELMEFMPQITKTIETNARDAAFQYLRAQHLLKDMHFAAEVKALVPPQNLKMFKHNLKIIQQEAHAALSR